MTLAAGVGSRWTTGAGVVKAVNPFVQLAGSHRSFLEIHLAKTGKLQRRTGDRHPARRDDQLPDPLGHRTSSARDRKLRPRRPGLPVARPVDRSAPDPDDPRSDASSGKRRVTRRSMRTSRKSARPADAQSSNGRRASGRVPTTPTMSRSSGSTRPATSTRSRTCSATACWPSSWINIPDLNWLLVHNIDTLGVTLEPGILSAVIDSGFHAQLRGDPQADRRPRRRPGQGRRPAPAARGTGAAARGHRVQAALLQHAHDLGADRRPARRRSG